MKRSTDPRHLARVLVLQKLFTIYFDEGKSQTEEMSVDDLVDIGEIKHYDKELYSKILKGVTDNVDQIDNIITSYAPQWPISHMKLVDLQILRISIFEGFIGKITPPKVAIDEAIELAKDFGGEVSSKFVNGILGALYENYKKDNHEENSTTTD